MAAVLFVFYLKCWLTLSCNILWNTPDFQPQLSCILACSRSVSHIAVGW